MANQYVWMGFVLPMYALGSVDCGLRDIVARWTRIHNSQDHNLHFSENLESHIISSICGPEVVHDFNCALKINTDGLIGIPFFALCQRPFCREASFGFHL